MKIVTEKSTLNQPEFTEMCHSWLKRSYYKKTLEWAYKGIKPPIIVEEFIDDRTGVAPPDFSTVAWQ